MPLKITFAVNFVFNDAKSQFTDSKIDISSMKEEVTTVKAGGLGKGTGIYFLVHLHAIFLSMVLILSFLHVLKFRILLVYSSIIILFSIIAQKVSKVSWYHYIDLLCHLVPRLLLSL